MGQQAPGNNIEIVLPLGVTAYFSAYTQTAATLTVTLKDSEGNTITTGSGTGLNFNPIQFSSPTYVVTDTGVNCTLSITNSNGNTTNAIFAETALSLNTQVYADTWTVVVEDATDEDYNDLYMTISWFAFNK